MKYECDKCDYKTDKKQSYCAHRSHCNTKREKVEAWNKGLTKETDERVMKTTINMKSSRKDPTKLSAVQSWRKRRKQEFVDYLGGKCVSCGYNKCLDALHFHHKDPDTKSFSINSAFAHPKRKALIKEEVDKCILLCANCHSEHHAGLLESVPA